MSRRKLTYDILDWLATHPDFVFAKITKGVVTLVSVKDLRKLNDEYWEGPVNEDE